ncbi:hypothetical protein YC2023_084347 [Brassica napus]
MRQNQNSERCFSFLVSISTSSSPSPDAPFLGGRNIRCSGELMGVDILLLDSQWKHTLRSKRLSYLIDREKNLLKSGSKDQGWIQLMLDVATSSMESQMSAIFAQLFTNSSFHRYVKYWSNWRYLQYNAIRFLMTILASCLV